MSVKIKGIIIRDMDKEVYDYFGIPCTCPLDINNAIEQADGKPLDVEITTCYGGEIHSGSEMYTALKSYKGGVNITITGLAASAASIVAMAGKCEMSPTAMLMVHNVSTLAQGDYHEMNKSSERLKQANKAMACAYTTKSGMSEDEAIEMMDKETWLTAEQALEKGLIDKVMFSDGQLVASISGGMLPKAVIEKTRNMLHPVAENKTEDKEDVEKLKAKLALQIEL